MCLRVVDTRRKQSDCSVRQRAVEKLADQAVLAQIATADREAYVRQAAVKKLTDSVALAHIATTDQEAGVRREAVEKLTDQAVLAQIATADREAYVRQAAAKRVTDPFWLGQIRTRSNEIFTAELMRFLTSDRTTNCERQTGAWWSRQDLELVIAKTYSNDFTPDDLFRMADAAIDELVERGKIVGTASGYRAK